MNRNDLLLRSMIRPRSETQNGSRPGKAEVRSSPCAKKAHAAR